MTYTITKTDGSTLIQLVDGEFDQTRTDLTLVGRNTSSYGQYINENFVWLLENFANTTPPSNPVSGQLWFDQTENRLKVYDGTGFKVTGGTILAPFAPSSISAGDIWIDSTRQQLYFNDGVSTKLAGPIWTAEQGVTGLTTSDVLDTVGVGHSILTLSVAGTPLGIFSRDSFTPASPIAGYSGPIETGFNVGTLTGTKFNVLASQASSLIAADGTVLTAADFLSATDSSSTTGTISIQNVVPLVLGESSSTEVNVTNSLFQIKSNTANQNFGINLLSTGLTTAFFINATTQQTGIYTSTPQATLDVNGDALIRGSLTVEGNLTSISTTNLEISDKQILLGQTDVPTNDTANGGGFVIAAGTDVDKQFIWEKLSPTDGQFYSSENLALDSGKEFRIGGFTVLTGSSLGASITSAPGISSLGTLTSLQTGYINVATNTISYVNPLQIDGDVVIAPKGAGSVDTNSAKIINLATPVDPTDGANKSYVDATVRGASLAISLDTTGLTDVQIAAVYLAKIFPSTEHEEFTVVRVVCTASGIVTLKQFQLLAGTWSFQSIIT